MLPFLSLGPLVIPSKPFVLIVGSYLSLWLLETAAGRLALDRDEISRWGSSSFLASIIGARLVFVAFNWNSYANNLIGIIWPISVGYSLFGGVIVGIVTLIILAYRKKLPLPDYFDPLSLALAGLMITFSLADWLGGPGYGAPANIFELRRHPVQLYEMLVGVIGLLVWWGFHAQALRKGWLFALTAAVISAGLVIVTPFRGGSPIIGNGWHIWQLLALTACLFSIGMLATMADSG